MFGKSIALVALMLATTANTTTTSADDAVFSAGTSLNNTGDVTNYGFGTVASGVLISSVIGTNVTSLTQNSATSGMTLTGATATINASTAINFNGGTLTLTNATTETGVDRIANGATITSNGGTFNWNNATSASAGYAENIGTLSLSAGQLNIISTTAMTSTGTATLTLGSGSLTHAATNTSTLAFGGASLGTGTVNNIVVTGFTDTVAGAIIGPWATYGTSAAAQTDCAVSNINAGTANTRGIQGAGIATLLEGTWTGGATGNYTTTAAANTITAARTMNSWRYN